MRAVGDETFEARFRFGHRIRLGDAGDGKAVRGRALDQRGLDRGRIGQKSRLA
jgi:hypothetical protein